MLKAEVHIGTHRVFGQIANAAYEGLGEVQATTKLVDDTFKDAFNFHISQGKSLVESPEWQVDKLVVSRASFLCGADKIFSHGGVYGTLAPELSSLETIFSGADLTIHLTIIGMHDFLTSIRGLRQRQVDKGLVQTEFVGFSWLRLVRQVCSAAPNTPIVVWDCENRHVAAFSFVRGLFGSEVSISRTLKRKIIELADGERGFDNGIVIPEDLSIYLDSRHDDDLLAISQLPNVTVYS